jgi:hypothetical protein
MHQIIIIMLEKNWMLLFGLWSVRVLGFWVLGSIKITVGLFFSPPPGDTNMGTCWAYGEKTTTSFLHHQAPYPLPQELKLLPSPT